MNMCPPPIIDLPAPLEHHDGKGSKQKGHSAVQHVLLIIWGLLARIMVGQSVQRYFFGDFSTYTFKYVNKTSHFVNNLYFGHNKRRFHSRVKSRSMFT